MVSTSKIIMVIESIRTYLIGKEMHLQRFQAPQCTFNSFKEAIIANHILQDHQRLQNMGRRNYFKKISTYQINNYVRYLVDASFHGAVVIQSSCMRQIPGSILGGGVKFVTVVGYLGPLSLVSNTYIDNYVTCYSFMY